MPTTEKCCKTCDGTGEIDHYHDAGDHFGAGTSPFSEWVKIPCPECKKRKEREEYEKSFCERFKSVNAAIKYANSLDW